MFSSLFFVPWIRIPNGAQCERGYGSALYLQYTNPKRIRIVFTVYEYKTLLRRRSNDPTPLQQNAKVGDCIMLLMQVHNIAANHTSGHSPFPPPPLIDGSGRGKGNLGTPQQLGQLFILTPLPCYK